MEYDISSLHNIHALGSLCKKTNSDINEAGCSREGDLPYTLQGPVLSKSTVSMTWTTPLLVSTLGMITLEVPGP